MRPEGVSYTEEALRGLRLRGFKEAEEILMES